MADTFDQLLRSELDAVEVELVRLGERRRLVEELLNLGPASPAASSSSATSTASSASRSRARGGGRRTAAPAGSATSANRPRQPRGLISAKIREFLGRQREPAHATAILAYLERQNAAPRSAKPLPTLQSNLQRMKETGELENTGRNHWRLRSSMARPATAASATSGESATSATSAPSPTAPTPAAPAAPDVPAAPTVPSVPPVPSAVPPVVTSTTRFGSSPSAGQ